MRRLLAVLGAAAAAGALALVPGPAHADCTAPELPVVGCVVPGATPTAEPPPSASPAPAASSPAATPAPTSEPGRPDPQAVAPEPALAPLVPAAPPVLEQPVQVAPPPVAAGQAPQPVVQPLQQAAAASAASPLAGTVAGGFAVVVFGLLVVPLLLGFLAGLRPAPALPGGRGTSPAAPSPPSYGGTAMIAARSRLWTGLGVLALAALIGGLGWYRLSGEPLLNRQIPFLASAGIAVVVLSVLGGSLIVAEQLRGDQQRIRDLEDAVRTLTEALSPVVEQPARRALPADSEVLSG